MYFPRRLLLLFTAFRLVTQVHAQADAVSERTIALNAAGLQYDLVRFSVKPGATVRVILTNNDDMGHNLVFTLPGAREQVVQEALQLGAEGLQRDFVPSSPSVLAFIPVLEPGQTASVTFRAPEEPGAYPYVCTFPGHGFVMYGAMYVTEEPLPALQDDLNIPPGRRGDAAAEKSSPGHEGHAAPASGHPYPLVPPFLFRAFLPDTGPDAIAVRLLHSLSYCWDAGACRLRYAWEGDFLDFTDFWKSYKKYDVKVVGTVFYRDETAFPLRPGKSDHLPAVQFKGYRLVDRYPEFHYTLDGLEVFELIQALPDGSGLIRTFRLPAARKPVWFVFSPEDGVAYACSKGKWKNGKLKLSPGEAKEFSLRMTKKEGVRK
jgi:plastocyanin